MPMMKKTITVPRPMEEWINAQTASGRYPSDSEYIRDLDRRDQERQDAYARLRVLIKEGEASGVSELSAEDVIAGALARLGAPDG